MISKLILFDNHPRTVIIGWNFDCKFSHQLHWLFYANIAKRWSFHGDIEDEWPQDASLENYFKLRVSTKSIGAFGKNQQFMVALLCFEWWLYRHQNNISYSAIPFNCQFLAFLYLLITNNIYLSFCYLIVKLVPSGKRFEGSFFHSVE